MSATPTKIFGTLPARQICLLAIDRVNKALHSRDAQAAESICGRLRTALTHRSLMPGALSEALTQAGDFSSAQIN
jgi:hypothetical protein